MHSDTKFASKFHCNDKFRHMKNHQKPLVFQRFLTFFHICSPFILASQNISFFIRFSLQNPSKIVRKTINFQTWQASGSTTLPKLVPEQLPEPQKRLRRGPGGSRNPSRRFRERPRAGSEAPKSVPGGPSGGPGTLLDPSKMVPGQPGHSPGCCKGFLGASEPARDQI